MNQQRLTALYTKMARIVFCVFFQQGACLMAWLDCFFERRAMGVREAQRFPEGFGA